jgi:hypothetical protein
LLAEQLRPSTQKKIEVISRGPLFLPKFFCNGSKKKIKRNVLDSVPDFLCSTGRCHLYALALAHFDSTLRDDLFCFSDGHHVRRLNRSPVFYTLIPYRIAGTGFLFTIFFRQFLLFSFSGSV